MSVVLDIWKTPKSISFPTKDITVVSTLNGPGGAVAGGGAGDIASSGPYVTQSHVLSENPSLGVVGGFAARVPSLDLDPDLSSLFTIVTGPDGHTLEYISYQAEIDLILAAHPDGTVIKSVPTGFDSAGNTVVGGGKPPYFMLVTVVGLGDPQYIDIIQSSNAFVLTKDFPIARASFTINFGGPSHVPHSNTLKIDGYDKPIKLSPQSDGSIKVTQTGPDGKEVAASPKWTFSQSHPDASSSPSTITLKIDKNGVS